LRDSFDPTAVRGLSDNTDLEAFTRQWRMIELLSDPQGRTLRQLADEFRVSQRTIRRDLPLLAAEAGLRLEEATGPHGRKTWKIARESQRPPLAFTPDEAAALYLGRQFLEPLAGTFLWDAAVRAFRKIRASLGDTAATHLQKLAGTVYQTTFGLCDYTTRGDLIDTLMIGLEDRRRVRLLHQSADATEPTHKTVAPLTLLWHRGALYLVAVADAASVGNETLAASPTIKHYKIDRCLDAEVLPESFTPPKDFDIRQHLQHTFGVFRRTANHNASASASPPRSPAMSRNTAGRLRSRSPPSRTAASASNSTSPSSKNSPPGSSASAPRPWSSPPGNSATTSAPNCSAPPGNTSEGRGTRGEGRVKGCRKQELRV
jgi:predicted DNA-binding transcriptional regulator YafY